MHLLLQILKLRREHRFLLKYSLYDNIKNFRFATTGSSDLEPSLRLIVPEKNPNITTVEPENGMVTSPGGLSSQDNYERN